MNIDANPKDFLSFISLALRADLQEISEDKFRYVLLGEIEKEINVKEIEDILEKLIGK